MKLGSKQARVPLFDLEAAKRELIDDVAEIRQSLEEELEKANKALEPTP